MKDYKKILEGVVNIINTTEKSDIGFANICAYIGDNCPELKESEDERIRKELLAFVIDMDCKESWIHWLERQGEQNPAWSEEDKTMLCYMEGHLEYLKNDKGYSSSEDQIMLKRQLDRLKSLKERYTWKPSDEQMQALKNAIHIKPFENPSDSILWGLYEQLKKLREE